MENSIRERMSRLFVDCSSMGLSAQRLGSSFKISQTRNNSTSDLIEGDNSSRSYLYFQLATRTQRSPVILLASFGGSIHDESSLRWIYQRELNIHLIGLCHGAFWILGGRSIGKCFWFT